MDHFTKDPLRLKGSRDSQTGQVYFPPRSLSADGGLRPTEDILLSPRGTLYTWTRFVGQVYGQVDLPDGVRIQTLLEDDAPQIGAEYELTHASGGEGWRFARG